MDKTYSYRALNDDGVVLTGSLDATDPEQARRFLFERGLMVTQLSDLAEKKTGMFRRLFAPVVTPKERILFSKQFCTLYKAGIPIAQLLQILQHQTEKPALRAVIADIVQRINRGSTLGMAFSAHPDVFSSLYCAMIRAGEISGKLDVVLERLIALLQHEYTIRCALKAALRYPKMVVWTLLGAFLILLNGVIPSFAQLFARSQLTLAFPTRAAMAMNRFLLDWWAVLLGLVLVGLFFWQHWVRTDKGRYARDRLLLALPLIGPVILKSIMARFASLFAVLQRSGVDILDTLDILSTTIGNAAIEREFSQIREQLRSGSGLSRPLGAARYFTPLVINMVAVGEQAGKLEDLLDELALHYDEEVAYAVDDMTEAIGPILVLALAVVIGFFALAVFLPMWDMVQLVR